MKQWKTKCKDKFLIPSHLLLMLVQRLNYQTSVFMNHESCSSAVTNCTATEYREARDAGFSLAIHISTVLSQGMLQCCPGQGKRILNVLTVLLETNVLW